MRAAWVSPSGATPERMAALDQPGPQSAGSSSRSRTVARDQSRVRLRLVRRPGRRPPSGGRRGRRDRGPARRARAPRPMRRPGRARRAGVDRRCAPTATDASPYGVRCRAAARVSSAVGRGWTSERPVAREPPGARPATRAVQPVGDGAQRVVVERRHAAGVDAAVGSQAVPALPDGGGAHRHRVQPGRALGLQQQPVGDVDVAGAGQRVADQRRSDEAGGDPESLPSARGRRAADPPPRAGAPPAADPTRWRGRRRSARRRRCVPDGVTNARANADRTSARERAVLLGLVVSSEQARGLGEDPRRAGEVRGGHDVAGPPWRQPGSSGGAVGSSQSPYWKPPLHSRSGPASVDDPVDPAAHARQLALQDLRDRRCAGTGSTAGSSRRHPRRRPG